MRCRRLTRTRLSCGALLLELLLLSRRVALLRLGRRTLLLKLLLLSRSIALLRLGRGTLLLELLRLSCRALLLDWSTARCIRLRAGIELATASHSVISRLRV